MKKLALFIFLLAATVNAQEGKYEKIKALKNAYITEKLELTPTEAEKFWPVYNSFGEKFRELRKRERDEIYSKLGDGINNLSDAEANTLIAKDFSLEKDKLELHKQLTEALRNVISAKRIILLKKTENDFKKELLDKYRHRKGEKNRK